jgi:hypothetical protein
MISNTADSFNSQEFSRRLSVLEKEVQRLKRQGTTSAGQKKWWHAIAGTFDGDPVYARIANEGRKWRQSQRMERQI